MQNDRDAALATYLQWVKAAPDNPTAHFRLAQVQRLRGESPAALQSLDRALAIRPDATEVLAVKAVTLAEVGRAEEGLRLARSLQERAPKSPLGFMAEGDILAYGKKQAAAAEVYAKAARLGNSGPLAATAYRAWVTAGQPQQADAFLRQWLAERPTDTVARHTLADGLLKRGNLREAQGHYEQLYKANPKDLIAANNLAWVYGELKDPRALQLAEAAHALAPEHPSTLDTLGWILVNQGQIQRARGLLERAHKLAPDSPEIQWHLAVALSKSGDRQRALAQLELLLNSGRDFADRQAAIGLHRTLKQ
jgi:putative PEP-CTERM system TPR-repeat lipoprotein